MAFEIKEFVNLGMDKDSVATKTDSTFAFHNHNIRITSTNDSTALSVTNERGPKLLDVQVRTDIKRNKVTAEKYNSKSILISAEYPIMSQSITVNYTVRFIKTVDENNNIQEYEDINYSSTLYKGQTSVLVNLNYNNLKYIILDVDVNSCIEDNYYRDDYFIYYTQNNIEPEDITSLYTEDIEGEYIGHCEAGDYFVLFTLSENITYIYRFELGENIFNGILLYHGDLNMSLDNSFESLYYYESEDIQKVYWVDSFNQPRVINIKSKPNYYRLNSQFDFAPQTEKYPKIKVQKNYNGTGIFPSGTIQYFISYYNKYGAETGILTQSAIQYISFEERGAKADEVVTCSFDITISNIDKSFDYVRIYSAKRSTKNGPIELHLVSDTKIAGDNLFIVDNNIQQETLDPSIIYFLGGEPFKAGTITSKDNTVFLGNIELTENPVPQSVKDAVSSLITKSDDFNNADSITFDYKCFTAEPLVSEYDYRLQTNYSNRMFKTFKRGETYRFAIQFLNKNGSWTTPLWIGDKKCVMHPEYDLANNQIVVPNARFKLPESIIDTISQYYSRYRILMAETNYTNRNILAQGVVCPTMFNYEERYNNKPFSIASWIMRPRGGNASWMHLSDTKINSETDAEIQSLTSSKPPIVEVNKDTDTEYGAIAIAVGISKYKKISVKIYSVEHIADYNGVISQISGNYKVLYSDYGDYTKWKNCYELLSNAFTRIGLSIDSYMSYSAFYNRTPGIGHPEGGYLDQAFDGAWGVDGDYTKYHFYIPKSNRSSDTLVDISNKKNNYYIDNSILTFHSPELDEVQDLADKANLSFRIVGIVPITASYSNAIINTKTIGVSPFYRVDVLPKSVVNFNNQPETLITGDFYVDSGWHTGEKIFPSSKLHNYRLYLWHKEGSIVGQNANTFKDSEGTTFNITHAELDNKTFATQRFSYATTYINYWNSPVSKIHVYNSDELTLKRIDTFGNNGLYYQGNYDKVIAGKSYHVFNEDNAGYTGNLTIVDNQAMVSSDPIRINYKSTTHAVFSLSDENGVFHLLPRMDDEDEFSISSIYPKDGNYDEIVYPWNDDVIYDTYKCLGFYKAPSEISKDTVKELLDKVVNSITDMESFIKDIKDSNVIAILVDNVKSIPIRTNKVVKLGVKTNVDEYGVKTHEITYTISEYNYSIPTVATNYYNVEMPDFTTDQLEDESKKTKIGKYFSLKNYRIIWRTKLEYKEENLKIKSPKYPYLYMGELYRNLPYSSLYGGYDDNALEKINWIPISDTVDINEEIGRTEGDTYYQRWDCLKTYPFTEESSNKVVDITSFMVESHINLDGRCDINRGNLNLLQARPTNFNLINPAYTQDDNIFKFNILDEKFDLNKFKNQVVWSLPKIPTEDIDSWTGITMNSSLYLDGSFGKVTKLLNVNDSIVAFQDKAISVINYNERTQLSTESGAPVEVQNSGRVNGFDYVTTNYGCVNNRSIVLAKSGVYFIDALNRSMSKFSKNGIEEVSSKGMSSWFKNKNLEDSRLLYDNITHDIYLVDNDTCLAYNEDLNRFSSFFSYEGINTIFNMKSESYIFKNGFYEMYSGKYGIGLHSDKMDYSIEYRVNPEPYIDKTFTNIEYIADILNEDDRMDSPHTESYEDVPFDKLDVWNSYQRGSSTLSRKLMGPLAKKFRIWRVQIPRDDNSRFKQDRIRSPWMHLRLSNSPTDKKMVFHNLIVKYYK